MIQSHDSLEMPGIAEEFESHVSRGESHDSLDSRAISRAYGGKKFWYFVALGETHERLLACLN